MATIPGQITKIPKYTDVPGGTLQDEIINYCEEMKILYPQFFVPIFLSSFACHVLNLRNKCLPEDRQVYPNRSTSPFYFEHGRVKDWRLHILFVSPPGFMKSFTIEGFLNEHYGFLANCGFPTRFENIVSEAGLVGSAYSTNRGIIMQEGLASKYKNGIFGFEEVSSILKARSADYNVNIINALLTILDSGRVNKKLLNCEFEYQTYITVWAGNQPEMVNNISGMMRRFLILLYAPDDNDLKKFSEAQSNGVNIKPKTTALETIRTIAKDFYLDMPLSNIDFHESIDKKLIEMNVPHFDWDIFKRFIVGYNVINNYDWFGGSQAHTDEIYVTFPLGGQLEALLELLVRMRYEAIIGEYWKSMLGLFSEDREYTSAEFNNKLCRVCHIPWNKAVEIKQELKQKGLISITRAKGKTRPADIIIINRSEDNEQ